MARATLDEVLTLDEAAQRLKLARKTVRDWVRGGKLPGFKLGRVWRVKASAVEQAIAEGEYPLPELLEMASWRPRHGYRWGPWRYNAERLTLVYDEPTVEVDYGIDLEACGTSAEVLDWIVQLSQKTWITRESVGCLVQALDHLLDPQGNLCRGGRSKRLNVRRWLQQAANASQRDQRNASTVLDDEEGGEEG